MVILDVREREEFEAEHVPESICCPLSQFDLMAPGILKVIQDGEVVIMCRSGNRAKMALTELKKLGVEEHHSLAMRVGWFSGKKSEPPQWKSFLVSLDAPSALE